MTKPTIELLMLRQNLFMLTYLYIFSKFKVFLLNAKNIKITLCIIFDICFLSHYLITLKFYFIVLIIHEKYYR